MSTTATIAEPEALTLEEQTAFNLKRWAELEHAPLLAQIEARIETDRYGYVVMSPYPGFWHASYQGEISFVIRTLLPVGRTVTECPISTVEGVKLADVAWMSRDRLKKIATRHCLKKAPQVCVEIVSPSNTRREMREKKALYFAAGASEVWFCDENGAMTFFNAPESTGEANSQPCPDFPRQIEL